MKHGWIGVVAGLAVGVTAVVMTQRGGNDGPRKPTAAEGSAALVTCDPGGSGLAAAYDTIAAPVHTYLTTDPPKALAAARGQVANLLDARIGACVRVLEAQQALGSAFRDPRLGEVRPQLERLHTARTRLEELGNAIETKAADRAQKLDALDAAMHSPQ